MATTPTYAPFILAPPLTTCTHAYLTFGQGNQPYTLNVLATGDSNGTSLETLPVQHSAGIYKWRVDFNEGANMYVALPHFAFLSFRPLRPALTEPSPFSASFDPAALSL
jgi:hypothetical protein